MSNRYIYEPRYGTSHALVVGINTYQFASPLTYERNDAVAVAQLLSAKHDFPTANVNLLLDERATKQNIMSALGAYQQDHISPDDRIIVYFAGHGTTRTGHRGEIGFLVPVDADPNDLQSLIRWSELTHNGELVVAKHILFIMDACYGGLALQRTVTTGSARYLKNMLQRYSRQVLTAGKADEAVADSGGPRAGHSIFTGHLLDALDGKAADTHGTTSANGVMAYVVDRVAKDYQSRQSPHFGFYDGDGDLILSTSTSLPMDETAEKEGSDLLMETPAIQNVAPYSNLPDFAETVKDFLSESRYRIRLDDLATLEIRSVLHLLHDHEFPPSLAFTTEAASARLRRYEEVLRQLLTMVILVAKWGGPEHQHVLAKILSRLADEIEPTGGSGVWLGMRWYPIALLMYTGGIAALAGDNYSSLVTLFGARLGDQISGRGTQSAIDSVVTWMRELDRANLFKGLPGYERNYVPRSEYLFKTIQPVAEDLLFVGKSYEELFDRFEILYALVYADLQLESGEHCWGPPGRFGWKMMRSSNPYTLFVAEAYSAGDAWGPIRAGLFGGRLDQFRVVAEQYRELLGKLNWF